MAFNSPVFIAFATLFFFAWPQVRKLERWRLPFLIACSLTFYGFLHWWFVLLLLGVCGVSFGAAIGMRSHPARAKALLVAALVVSLGVLFAFKYFGFFGQIVRDLGLYSGAWPSPILPIGISFFTFQCISYLADVYRGVLQPTRRFDLYLSFVSLFPHLIAGPIVRAKDILPQLATLAAPTAAQRWVGLRWIALGYFKKVVLSDSLAPFVNTAFDSSASHSLAFWWLAAICFGFQIYFDFSGYTDIARGLAKWIGVDFCVNFNHPYVATGFQEFWTRWHISLSTWIRDYVYIPLGGSRGGKLRTHVNLWVSFLLSGLWHGANWTFVAWGGLHAAFLTVERLLGIKPTSTSLLQRTIWIAITFACVTVAWVFFRAASIGQAADIVGVMLGSQGLASWDLDALEPRAMVTLVFSVALEAFLAFRTFDSTRLWLARTSVLEPVCVGLLLAASVFLRGPGHRFIYFQF